MTRDVSPVAMFFLQIFYVFRDPEVKANVERVILSMAREAHVLLVGLSTATAKHFLNEKGCRWAEDNAFSTATVTIDHYCALHTAEFHNVRFLQKISQFPDRFMGGGARP